MMSKQAPQFSAGGRQSAEELTGNDRLELLELQMCMPVHQHHPIHTILEESGEEQLVRFTLTVCRAWTTHFLLLCKRCTLNECKAGTDVHVAMQSCVEFITFGACTVSMTEAVPAWQH